LPPTCSPVAGHGHEVARVLQHIDDGGLLPRLDPGVDVGLADACGCRAAIVPVAGDLAAGHHVAVVVGDA